MKTLPDTVASYKRTVEFDQDSIPQGLLNEHRTKSDVWGKIVVLSGQLRYTILEPQLETVWLDVDTWGIVEPGMAHQVRPEGAVRFYVEFYK